MMMGDRAFVDTNVLLRAVLKNMDLHVECKALVQQMIQDGVELWINGQVIREFIVQATHPRTMKQPLTIEETIQEINRFQKLFHVADETESVRAKLLEILQIYPTQGKQIHDANLVATMLVYGLDTLLTLNDDDLKRFQDQITLVSPVSKNP